MNTITTKRNILKFYIPLFACLIFFWGVGAFAVSLVFDPAERAGFRPGGIFLMPLLGIALILFGFYSLYQYFKNSPVITVDHDKISFNKDTYSWTDVTNIALTGKQPFRYILNFPMEGAAITFKDGKVRYIFDDIYVNGWQLKLFIQNIVIKKKASFELPDIAISRSEIDGEIFETFKGNMFTSFRGITLWGMQLFLLYFVVSATASPGEGSFYYFMGGISLVWFLFHAYLMHYFRVSCNLLEVRNHILFWRTHAFRLSDIKEIAFESQGKMPNCLRIITKDFRTRLFPAGTLRDKTWLQLKDKLENCYISVRNECI